MAIETLLTFLVIRFAWQYPLLGCLFATGFFLIIDAMFLAATLLKIFQDGWFPLVIASLIFLVMITWKTERRILAEKLCSDALPLEIFLESLLANPPVHVIGTAVYLTFNPRGVPHALFTLAHNQVLHESVVFLTVEYLEIPSVPHEERITVKPFFIAVYYQIKVRYGFKEKLNLPLAAEKFKRHGFELELLKISFFLIREIVVPTLGNGITPLQKRIFAIMRRNSNNTAELL